MSTPHLLVVGAGLAGSFAAHAAARRGAKVTLIEQFAPGHPHGSSHGGSRIFRHAYEESDYVRLAVHADEGWQALERDAGERLLWRAGGLDFALEGAPALNGIEAALGDHGSRSERLSAAEVRRRFPLFAPDDGVEALFQPDAGVVAADRALVAALRRAADLGAELRFGTPVASLGDARGVGAESGVTATLADGSTVRADRGLVAAGPWLAEGPLALHLPLRVERQQVVYLRAPTGEASSAETLPVFIDREAMIYGMGRLEHPGAVKVADHVGSTTITLAERPSGIDVAWAEVTEARARRLIPSLGERVDAAPCLYTVTPDEDFVIGPHPAMPSWTVAGGLSGHGFKFGPALGEMLAELALDGGSRWWAQRFSPDRFA